ncbi:MAG TPA: hypothetical protein VN864_05330 [Thermoplasmata archaeon]|nr:hypothetical protein [Thermoplasmata archaeon]
MRPWLVLVGAAFLVVGGGALGALLLLPAPTVAQQVTSQDSGVPTLPGATESFALASTSVAHGTLKLDWSASGPVKVQLASGNCPLGTGGCPVLRTWASNASGAFSITGPLVAAYTLTWTTPLKEWANVTIDSSVTWNVGAPVSFGQGIAEVASGLLAAVGAVGLFLGLFLRGDFRRPPAVVSRHADDAEGVGGAIGPRTGPSADGSGPPRPGPPSRSG